MPKWFNLILLTLAIGLARGTALADDASAPDQLPAATTYQIRNVRHGELLRPRDANNANGTPLVLYPAQPWKCMTWRLLPAANATFHVQNVFTSKTFCIATDTNGLPPAVTQVPLPKDGAGAPAWQFVHLEDGNYKIADPQSGRVLTAVKSDDADEARIVAVPWQNLAGQKWRLEKMDPKDLTM